ncbi:MAG TPA: hypothetical protein VM600_03160, partial [Actinomycetota bacterium]|nr:hypothetical protein [Actinomycetota bacterium]
MRRMFSSILCLVSLTVGALMPTPSSAVPPALQDPDPCIEPVGDPDPGTAEWRARDALNVACALQRHVDKAAHPSTPLPVPASTGGSISAAWNDAYRQPARHDGIRFRYQQMTIGGLAAEVFRPCAQDTCPNLPEGLQRFDAPYPVVVVFHGNASRRELHWWSTQTLAEAGYMTVAINSPGYPSGPSLAHARTIVDWLFDDANPLASDIDRERIGLAGHSLGGQVSSVFGQQDARVGAIVSWDRGTGLALPQELNTPTLFVIADYNCQANPVCQPEPYFEPPPDTRGPAGRGREYEVVSAAGVDSMKIALRATAHLDWTPSLLAGNRYAELISVYYALAWFDRYLKGVPTGDASP